MKTYKVIITNQHVFIVKANSKKEAESKASRRYTQQDKPDIEYIDTEVKQIKKAIL